MVRVAVAAAAIQKKRRRSQPLSEEGVSGLAKHGAQTLQCVPKHARRNAAAKGPRKLRPCESAARKIKIERRLLPKIFVPFGAHTE